MAAIQVNGINVEVSTLSQVDELIVYSDKNFLKSAWIALKEKVNSFGDTINPEKEIYQQALLEVQSSI